MMSKAAIWSGVLAAWVIGGACLADSAAGLSGREAQVFQRICAECHTRPGLGVPLIGDEAAWQERRAKGLGALLANTVDGLGGMPPLGTCSFCTEEELRHLVAFLAGVPLEAAK